MVLFSCAALLFAAPASADQTDDAFIAALAGDGIVMPDRGNAISMAHTACAGLANNQTSTALAMRLAKENNLPLKQAGYFLGASVAAYCPQYRGNTDNSVGWLLPYPTAAQ